MKCARCPVAGPASCLGESVTRLCHLAATRADYRGQLVRLAGEVTPDDGPPALDLDALLASVRCCAHRGRVLPPSLQPACSCAELTECHAGRGEFPGRVTLQACLACVAGKHA